MKNAGLSPAVTDLGLGVNTTTPAEDEEERRKRLLAQQQSGRGAATQALFGEGNGY